MTEEEINEVYEKAFEIAYGSNRVLLLNDPVIDAISKEVKKALGNDLVSRIEHLDRNKAIMIVCGDDHLTKGIVDYIWYTHPTKLVRRNTGLCPAYIGLRHRSYSWWTEEQVALDIRGWEISLKAVYFGTHDYKYKWDYIQFLQNVTGGYQEVFKRLLNLARDYKLGNERMLIVSTDKVDNLPQELSRQFELIKPEIEEKSIPASTPQDTAKQAKFIPFPTPSGTQWHEVGISFIDRENVKISVREKTATKHFFDMGFRKGNTCKPVKSWHTLFAFSEKRCLKYSQSIKSKTEKDIQDLRKRLKAYFGIQDDPIILDHGYEPVFKVCGSESEGKGRSVRAFSNSDTFNDDKEDD